MAPSLWQRLLAHLPWYDVDVQTGKDARAKRLGDRAHSVRISVERVLEDYTRAEQARRK